MVGGTSANRKSDRSSARRRRAVGKKLVKREFSTLLTLKCEKNDGFCEKSPFRQELIPEMGIFSPFCKEMKIDDFNGWLE